MSDATTESNEDATGIDDGVKDKLLRDFDSKEGLFKDCATKVESLIRELLSDKGITVHSVTSRPKDRESFEKKIVKKAGKYAEIEDITDLAGIRIITHFHDEVDKIAETIEEEFEIDPENSVDKRKDLAPKTFGYLSLHYVASFRSNRFELGEYRRYEGVKFEIQIRSVLQHAWAEIEHDYYKRRSSLPPDIQRRFARLAGLLEIGDNEFAQIRDAIADYKDEVTSTIKSNPESVSLDEVSLELFIRGSDIVRQVDDPIAALENAMRVPSIISIAYLVFSLKYLGYTNISEIENALGTYSTRVLYYAQTATKKFRAPNGISLLYMVYIRAFETGGENFIVAMLDKSEARFTIPSTRVAKNIATTASAATRRWEEESAKPKDTP